MNKENKLIEFVKRSEDKELLDTLSTLISERDQYLRAVAKLNGKSFENGFENAITIAKKTATIAKASGKSVIAAGKGFWSEMKKTYAEAKNSQSSQS